MSDDKAPPAPDADRRGPQSVLAAAGMRVLAVGIFTLMSAIIKWLGSEIPPNQIAFARNLFAFLPLIFLLHQAGGLAALKTRRPGAHATRSIVGVTAMLLNFSALTLLPLATAVAFTYAAPIFTTILAALLLREDVRIFRWAAVAVGFVGILVMLQPAGMTLLSADTPVDTRYLLGVTCGLAGALFLSSAMISIRSMTATESSLSIVFYFTAAGALITGLTLPFAYVMPSLEQAIGLVAIGILGGLGQMALTASYRKAPASAAAPFDYTGLIWAMALGYGLFGEIPSGQILTGAAIVIGAGLFILYRENRRRVERAAPKTPPV